jgi:hypothetical protein
MTDCLVIMPGQVAQSQILSSYVSRIRQQNPIYTGASGSKARPLGKFGNSSKHNQCGYPVLFTPRAHFSGYGNATGDATGVQLILILSPLLGI